MRPIALRLQAFGSYAGELEIDFVPDSEVVVPAAQEIVLMEAERIRSGRFTE